MPTKKKSLMSAFSIVIILSGLFLVLTVHLSGAQTSGTNVADSNVSGIISSNTTWTPANSPYTFTGPVAVNAGVTLTIEAGAVIYFGDGNHLQVNGTLVAKGTSANNIQFSNGTITFTPVSTGWNELTGSGSIIQYADFSSCQVNVQSPAKIDHDTFNGGRPNCDVNASCGVISNNSMIAFSGSGIDCSGNASVLDNNIDGGSIFDNTIVAGGNTVGISVSSGSPLIQGNLVTNNLGTVLSQEEGGIYVGSTAATPIIENNALTGNAIGIAIGFQEGAGTVEPNIINNSIYSNQQYNFELNGISYNVSATNNWWGTTNTQAINRTIYDFKDDHNLGNVSFVPFLDSPNTEAPTFVNATAGSEGSISPSGVISINYGGSQTFTITPNSGYAIANVLINGTSIGAVTSYTAQDIRGATSISVTFEPAPVGPTQVIGILASNTIWYASGSPYTLTGNVLVNSGVTLTIQAGSTVNLGNYYIEVDGILNAKGTNSNNIFLISKGTSRMESYSPTWGTIIFSIASGNGTEQNNSSSILEDAVISSTETVPTILIVDASPKINNCTVLNSGGQRSIFVNGGEPVISNDTISSSGEGITFNADNNNGLVSNNVISGCSVGIEVYGGSPTIECNLIINNTGTVISGGGGIRIDYAGTDPTILNNTITENSVGFNLISSPIPTIIYNNIQDNNEYNLYLYPSSTQNTNNITATNATNNWWGTTETQTINQTIYDFKDNFNLANVTFVPFLTAPNTEAPTFVNATAGADGSISPSGIISLKYGSSQTFTITPSTGYHIVNVLVNGTSVGAVGSYTVQDVNGATTISAIFAANPTSTPSPTPSPPASPSPTPTPTPEPSRSPAPSSLPQPTLSVSCVSSTSYSGFNVQINGELAFDGTGISGAPILLSYSVTGGSSWQSLTLVDTNSGGNFSAEWLPSVTGNYLINATYAGNSAYLSVSTIVNLVVIPFTSQNAQDVFSVASNSTVSDLAFNSTSNELTFTVSGPRGTGYVDVYVAKSLIGDISTLQVSLDGNQKSYTATSQGSSWVIYFTFGLSTHQVTVHLASKSVSKISEFPSLLVVLTVFMAVSLAIAVLVKARKSKIIKSPDKAREKS